VLGSESESESNPTRDNRVAVDESMQGLLIVAEPDGPVLLRYPILLEALLARLIADQGEQFDSDRIPLCRHEGIWAASQSFLIRPVVHGSVHLVRAVKPGLFLERHTLTSQNRIGRVETKRRNTQNLLDERPAVLTSAIIWLARGEFSRVQDLVCNMREIGGKRAQGFGVLRRVRVEPLGARPPLFGLVHNGEPVRPLPLAWWSENFPDRPALQTDLAIGLPRWSAAPEPVVIPRVQELWPDELQTMIEPECTTPEGEA